MKMTFLPEGPLVSSTALTALPGPTSSPIRPSPRDKLKDLCSMLLHWEAEHFEEVEVNKSCHQLGLHVHIGFTSNSCIN
jgi:hypothetical protein